MATKKGGLGRGLGSLLGDLSSDPVSIIEGKIERQSKKDGNSKTAAATAKTAPAAAKSTTAAEKKKAAEKPVDKVEKVDKAKKENSGSNFAEGVVYLSIDDIKPNSKQPRKVFNEEALDELAASIKEYGVIQPILVRKASSGFELVAGERRWRAARKAGLKKIPAIVRELTERQNSLVALLENMQREDLNMIEEAQGIMQLMGDYGLSQEEAAQAVGKSRPYIANALRLLKLPAQVQDMVQDGRLSAGHAKALAGLESAEVQIEAANKAVAEGWSVRKIENYSTTKKAKPAKKKSKKDSAFKETEEKISRHIGTKVKISGSEVKGKIEIEYFSRLELDRLIDLLSDN